MPNAHSIQFSFRRGLFGPVLVVRKAEPNGPPNLWKWGRWKSATRAETDVALMQVRLLNYPSSKIACRSCGCAQECDPHAS